VWNVELVGKNIESDSKLLSEFPFIGHGNPDNNLESVCTFRVYENNSEKNTSMGLKTIGWSYVGCILLAQTRDQR
jgi:hypothetical protein